MVCGSAMPNTIRRYLRSQMRQIALTVLSKLTTFSGGPFLRLLYTHSVPDQNLKNFKTIIGRLKELGTFVDTDTCVSMIEGRAEISRNYFHLSFDDGSETIYQNAAPILKQLEIPAIVFVSTGLVRKNGELQTACPKSGNGGDTAGQMISWSQLETMMTWGIDVGSHGRTHIRFSTVSESDVLNSEIVGSKNDIESNLGKECRYIAAPFGLQADLDTRSLDVVRKAGYRACFGAFRGSVYPGGAPDKYRVPRHHFESSWPWDHVKFFAGGNWER